MPGEPSEWCSLPVPAATIADVPFLFSFYEGENGKNWLKDHRFMLEWAQTAGKLVLREVEELHEEDIVTFLNLALFWHTQGSWMKCFIHKGAKLRSDIRHMTTQLTMLQESLIRY